MGRWEFFCPFSEATSAFDVRIKEVIVEVLILSVLNRRKTKILNFIEKVAILWRIKNYFVSTRRILTSVKLRDRNFESFERGEFGNYFGEKKMFLYLFFVNEESIVEKVLFEENSYWYW